MSCFPLLKVLISFHFCLFMVDPTTISPWILNLVAPFHCIWNLHHLISVRPNTGHPSFLWEWPGGETKVLSTRRRQLTWMGMALSLNLNLKNEWTMPASHASKVPPWGSWPSQKRKFWFSLQCETFTQSQPEVQVYGTFVHVQVWDSHSVSVFFLLLFPLDPIMDA